MNNLIHFLNKLAQAATYTGDTVISPYFHNETSFEIVTDGGVNGDMLIVYVRTGQAHIMCFPRGCNRAAFCNFVGLDPEVAS